MGLPSHYNQHSAPRRAQEARIPAAPSVPLRSCPSPQTDDPVLLSADIAKKQDTVTRVCQPIVSKPPPKKKEEPAPAAVRVCLPVHVLCCLCGKAGITSSSQSTEGSSVRLLLGALAALCLSHAAELGWHACVQEGEQKAAGEEPAGMDEDAAAEEAEIGPQPAESEPMQE